MQQADNITYEPDDASPLWPTFVVGFQGVLLALAPGVAVIILFTQASGLDERYLSWSVFVAVAISGLTTAIQALRLGRLGGGHLLISSASPSYAAVAILAVEAAGPPLMASLIVVASVLQFAMAWWMPLLRRIITPMVTGVMMMLIGISVMPIAVGRLAAVPEDAPSYAGLVVGAVTLAVIAVVGLRARGPLRLWGPLISIVVGSAVAAAFGLSDPRPVLDAPWVGLPELAAPGFDLSFGPEFWALLPMFALVAIANAVKAAGSSIVVQRASRNEPRVTDYRLVQGAVNSNTLGTLVSGLTGVIPVGTNDANTVTLSRFTGVATRRVGYAVGAMLLALIFLPKVITFLITIPSVALSAYLLFIMGMIFVEAMRTIFQDGLEPRKALVVATSMTVGIGFIAGNPAAGLLSGAWELLLSNGMMVGALVAVFLIIFVEIANPRRRKLEVELNVDSLPRLDAFLAQIAERAGWDEAASNRLRFVGEEALNSLLGDDPHQAERRLVVSARPSGAEVELEFLAALQEVNIEDQMAYMGEQGDALEERQVSLRLLRHFASSVHHRKYHGIDIVTVEVLR